MMPRELMSPRLNYALVSGMVRQRKALARTSRGRYVLCFEVQLDSGTDEDPVIVLDMEIWGEDAEEMDKRLENGMSVLVEGHLASVTFEDRTGTPRHRMVMRTHQVQILDTRS